MKKKFFILLLIICMCMALVISCDGTTSIDESEKHGGLSVVDTFPTTEELPTYTETVYNFYKIADQDGSGMTLWSQSTLGDEFWLLFFTNGQMIFYVYDTDGTLIRTVPIPDTVLSNYVVPYDEDSFLYAEMQPSFTMQFIRCTHDGEIIETSPKMKRYDYDTMAETPQLRRVGDGFCYFVEFTMYLFTDGDISQAPLIIDLPCRVRSIDVLPDGKWLLNGYILTASENLYYILDPHTGDSTEYRHSEEIAHPRTLFHAARTTYYQNQVFYGICTDGLYRYQNGASEVLIDWVQSNLDQNAIELMYVLSDTCYVVSYDNVMTGTNDVCFLKQSTEIRTVLREIVSIASIGLSSQYRKLIEAAVIQFNRENDDYKLLYHDYNMTEHQALLSSTINVLENEEERAAAQREFEEDLLSGVVYDCYLFPEVSPNRQLLAEKGLLVDLSQYLAEEQVMGCIETAYRTQDGITALPLFMKLSTLITSQQILVPSEKLTYDVMYDMADSLETGETLFAQDVYAGLKTTGQYEFLDYDAQICSFDSDDCLNWMHFLNQIRSGVYTDETMEVVHTTPSVFYSDNRYHVPSLNTKADIMSFHRLKFMEFHFNSVNDISTALWCYSGERINYCGYPSENDTVVLLSSDAVFSISAMAENPAGANAFLQYLLSVPIQTSQTFMRYGLPVARESLTKVFPVGYLHYRVKNPDFLDDEQIEWNMQHPDGFFLYIMPKNERMTVEDQERNGIFEIVHVTEDDRDLFLRFLDRAVMRTAADATLQSILDEELSYVESGVRPPEEAGKILQSRVGIYLAE